MAKKRVRVKPYWRTNPDGSRTFVKAHTREISVHVAGKWKLADLGLFDEITNEKGDLLTGKGNAIVLDKGIAMYDEGKFGGIVKIKQINYIKGETSEVLLSKKEIEEIHKNF